MRDRVFSLVDYKPEAAVAKDEVDQKLNEALQTIWDAKPWNFAERTAELPVFPDIDADTSGLTCHVTLDSREVVFSATVPELYPDSVQEGVRWIGQTFHTGSRNYRIQSVNSAGDTIILDEPIRYASVNTTATPTDWELRQSEIWLPEDCAEVLGVTDADNVVTTTTPRQAGGLLPRRAEDLGLRAELEGVPDSYIPLPDLEIPAAGTIVLTTSEQNTQDNTYGIPGGRFVQLAWAFSWANRVGPLSEYATVELPDPAKFYSILLAFYAADGFTAAQSDGPPDYDTRPFPLAYEGLRKRVFFNSNIDPTTGDRIGLPCWRECSRRALLATPTEGDSYPLEFADTSAIGAVNQSWQISPGNRRVRTQPDGTYQRFRLYPRPNSTLLEYPQVILASGSFPHVAPKMKFRRLHVRYRARPPLMAEANDAPACPLELHLDIVHLVAAQLLMRWDPPAAARYEARVDAHLGKLASKYVARTDVTLIRGSGWADQDVGARRSLFAGATFTRLG